MTHHRGVDETKFDLSLRRGTFWSVHLRGADEFAADLRGIGQVVKEGEMDGRPRGGELGECVCFHGVVGLLALEVGWLCTLGPTGGNSSMTQKGYCRRGERIYKLSLGQRVRSDNPSLLLTLRPLPDMSSISAPSPSRLLSTSDFTPRRLRPRRDTLHHACKATAS